MATLLNRAVENFVSDEYLGIANRFALVDVHDNEYGRTYYDNLFDRRTGEVYAFENPNDLVSKFVAALFALPVYAGVKGGYHVAAVPYVVGETLLQAVNAALGNGEFDLSTQSGKLGHHLVEPLRCGYFFGGISLALIRGIYLSSVVNPLHAHETRTVVAHLEQEWSHQTPRNKDFRFYENHHDWSQVEYYYLAFCFLPHGKIDDQFDKSEEKRYSLNQQRIL